MGMSQKIVGPITLDDHVRDLAGLLDHLEIQDPVHIAGCAVGGAIALAYAAALPDRVSGVVAMCPATDVTEEKRQRSLAQIDRIEREGMNVSVNGGLASGYPPEVRHDIERYNRYLIQYGGNDPRSFAATLRMVAEQDFIPKLSGIRCPTLVLAGRYDQGRPPSMVKRTADAVPGSTYKIVESAHFMPVQTPALVSHEIDEFFDLGQGHVHG
jgi:3-oxoadipate enol-lactonase